MMVELDEVVVVVVGRVVKVVEGAMIPKEADVEVFETREEDVEDVEWVVLLLELLCSDAGRF